MIFDEEEQVFKMWYRIVRKQEKDSAQTAVGGYGVCYAVSKDGIHWDKPKLGLTRYKGSADNNIIPPAETEGGMHFIRRPNLIKDYLEPDPEKRYKMVYRDQIKGTWGLYKAFSRDGIHWKMGVGLPTQFKDGSELGVLMGWDPNEQKYVFFHRGPFEDRYMDVDGRKWGLQRSIVRAVSTDFIEWVNTQEAVVKDENHQDFSLGNLTAIPYTESLYIGFAGMGEPISVEEVSGDIWRTTSREEARDWIELMISHDGRTWEYAWPNQPYLRHDLYGGWDGASVEPARPIVKNDEILMYYGGTNLASNANYPGHPQHDLYGKMDQLVGGQRMGYQIGLAQLRLDGFASMDAYETGGSLTTRLLIFDGVKLVINARVPGKSYAAQSAPPDSDRPPASSHSPGAVKVEILDADGRPVKGYTSADCDPFSGDEICHVVSWKGNRDIEQLAGTKIRLKFYLRNAALYSFQFLGQVATTNGINRLCPGCRGRGGLSGRPQGN